MRALIWQWLAVALCTVLALEGARRFFKSYDEPLETKASDFLDRAAEEELQSDDDPPLGIGYSSCTSALDDILCVQCMPAVSGLTWELWVRCTHWGCEKVDLFDFGKYRVPSPACQARALWRAASEVEVSYRRRPLQGRRKAEPLKTQRFLSAGLVEMPMRGALGEGAPVRILCSLWGVPEGKYRGRVSAYGESIWDDKGFVRVVVTRAPCGAVWMVGRPLYIKPSQLKLLPSKRHL